MLKYIKVKNFLSFKEETEINFESSLRGKKDNVFKIGNDVLMKNMLIYGANASGKSNVLEIIKFITEFVLKSYKSDFNGFSSPFLLDSNSIDKGSFFEIGFYIDNIEFKYNFEIFGKKVKTENLYKILYINKEKREEIIFKRELQKIVAGKSFKKELKKGKDKIREDSGVISVLSQWNGMLEGKNIDYFFKKIYIIGIDDYGNDIIGNFIESNKKYKTFFIKFLGLADINIDDIKIGRETISKHFLDHLLSYKNDEDKEEMLNYISTKIEFGHKVKDSNILRYFNLGNESAGTQKLFTILLPIINTIFNEGILFIDEIENKLHLHILKEIISFINSDIKGKKYQFIFTTHNVGLMDLKVLKKEQIGIVEKNKDGESEFYTLYDFNKVREGIDLKKYFNAGVYGGIPNIGDFKSLLNNFELGVEEKN